VVEMFKLNEANRILRHYYQYHLLEKLDFKDIIEVGIRYDILTHILRRSGFKTTTVDIDAESEPDVVADIREPLNVSADLVLCFETLEHLPYSDFQKCLHNLRKAARKYVIISIPDVTPSLVVWLDIPMVSAVMAHYFKIKTGFMVQSGLFGLLSRKFGFDGSHYWEAGKRGYPQKRIRRDIEDTGMRIIKDYRSFFLPYHHYYVMRASND